MKALLISAALFLALAAPSGCKERQPNSDSVQADQQERLLQEGTAQVGMPAITHFTERKLLKDILELRDQQGLTTYTYLVSEMTNKLTFFCDSIGYGIPYATQFTNPQKIAYTGTNVGIGVLPQADPNGLFSPAAAEGTWVLCKDPNGTDVKPLYVEPRIIVSPFKLNVDGPAPAAPPAKAERP